MENTNTSAIPGKTANAGKGSQDSMLQSFFIDQLKDIYWAEKRLVKTIPKMQEEASSGELRQALGDHLQVTRNHVRRLEEAFQKLGEDAETKKCDAMNGIIKEGNEIINDTEEGSNTRDVGIIMAAQKVEHYEISTYGGLKQLATTLGHDEVASLLSQTLEEEKEADATLTQIAENDINYEAAAEPEK